jgi:uncharacterized membrane protein
MILSNTRIMPMESPAYDFIDTYLVPLAVALLLLRANVVEIFRSTGIMLVAFHVATLSTIVGCLLAALLLHDYVSEIGPISGVMAASYIGGGVNFYAAVDSFELNSTLAGSLMVADNFIMAGAFIVMLYIAGSPWFRRRFRSSTAVDEDAGPARNLAAEHWKRKEISLLDLAAALAVALAIVATAMLAQRLIESRLEPGMLASLLGNRFVLVTGAAVLAATALGRYLKRIHGAEEVGALLLFVFLFRIGLPADLVAVVLNVPMLFVLCLVIAVCNMGLTLVLGKLLRLPLEELVLAMNATLGGPSTAAAMAISKGWSRLVLPALLAGLWGYVIGTPIGIFVGEFIRARW